MTLEEPSGPEVRAVSAVVSGAEASGGRGPPPKANCYGRGAAPPPPAQIRGSGTLESWV